VEFAVGEGAGAAKAFHDFIAGALFSAVAHID